MQPRWSPGMGVALAMLAVLGGLGAGCAGSAQAVRRAAEAGDIPSALRFYHAYMDERGGGNADLLAEVALGILRDAAGSADPRVRSAGFAALRTVGVRGRDVLEPLSHRPGVVGDRAAAALYDLDGHTGAVPPRLTAALASTDPEVRVAGMASLGPGSARALVALLADTDGTLRRAAAQRLGRIRGAAVRAALMNTARTDRDGSVRAAAVVALGAQGPEAANALLAALSDPDLAVRLSAPSALMQSSPDEAAEALAPWLTGEPTDLALESARVLAGHGNPQAEAYVLAALGSPRPEIRSQAAVAANALPEGRSDALAAHLGDADPELVFRLAAILVRRSAYKDRALDALRPLSERPEPFLAIRALQAMASAGDPDAVVPIREALAVPDASIRRMAVLAWPDVVAMSGNVDPLVPLLTDPDRSVALMAAAEVVLISTR